jgi:peptidyl-prolyl cis-trans isomerase SurA
MKINKKLVKIIFIFHLFFLNQSAAIENKILFKVNNQIITSIDILNEINYLSLINSDFQKLDKQKIYEVSKNSLIREKIKEIDLKKKFVELKLNEEYLNELIENYSRRIGFKNANDLNIKLKKNNIKIDSVVKKITIEAFWNQLIIDKFLKSVKINEASIKKELQNQKMQKEYLLSEILFGLENNNELVNKMKLIKKSILDEGFSKAALIHSISDTSNSGGKLDWINEASLNIKIKSALNKLEIGAHTEPILLPGGYLILKINDIKEVEKKINFEKEFEKVKRAKTNEQLNIMSNLYFNKIKKNILINEL